MDVNILERKMQHFSHNKYVDIINFIIDAVRDYPKYDLSDFYLYLEEVKRILGNKTLNLQNIKEEANYLNNTRATSDTLWIGTSLAALANAFDLMKMYNVNFEDVVSVMESIYNDKSRD